MTGPTDIPKRRSVKSRALRRRQLRVRKRISGQPERPRLVVSRSLRHVTAQIVDDTAGRTLAAASSMETGVSAAGDKTAQARRVGQVVAQRATEAGVTAVVFDRGGRRYHGRVAALADGAREGGLAF